MKIICKYILITLLILIAGCQKQDLYPGFGDTEIERYIYAFNENDVTTYLYGEDIFFPKKEVEFNMIEKIDLDTFINNTEYTKKLLIISNPSNTLDLSSEQIELLKTLLDENFYVSLIGFNDTTIYSEIGLNIDSEPDFNIAVINKVDDKVDYYAINIDNINENTNQIYGNIMFLFLELLKETSI